MGIGETGGARTRDLTSFRVTGSSLAFMHGCAVFIISQELKRLLAPVGKPSPVRANVRAALSISL